jgi:hypothetical protein
MTFLINHFWLTLILAFVPYNLTTFEKDKSLVKYKTGDPKKSTHRGAKSWGGMPVSKQWHLMRR